MFHKKIILEWGEKIKELGDSLEKLEKRFNALVKQNYNESIKKTIVQKPRLVMMPYSSWLTMIDEISKEYIFTPIPWEGTSVMDLIEDKQRANKKLKSNKKKNENKN